MTALRELAELFARWMDAVTAFILGIAGRFSSPNLAEVVEQADGTFVLRKAGSGAAEPLRIVDGQAVAAHPDVVAKMLHGGRADVVLQPRRFMFRPLELPQRAGEFLDGVVRAQIDRLTPWSAAEAVFGWSKPAQSGTDRIAVTVAATARAVVQPYVQALLALGARSVTVLTVPADATAATAPIKVLEQSVGATLDAARIRRIVTVVLVIAALAAAVSFGASSVVSASLSARQDDLARRIALRRAEIRNGRERGELASTPLHALERRKYEQPVAVLVLDTLSQILPDHTYVVELRIEGDKLRLTGITRDAPGLIRLIEQNPMFTRATFFAPTTRAPSDPGERFHIEAHIEPIQAPRS